MSRTRSTSPAPPLARRAAAEGGFTLVELLLVMVMIVVLVVVTLNLFDGMNRMARAQTNLSELQQSQRVAQNELVQMVRMAGRGGLGDQPLAMNVAALAPVAVRNNLAAGDLEVVAGEGVEAVAGSDVLTVRGVFETPVYRIDYVDADAFDPVGRRLVVSSLTPTGVEQDLQPLRDAIDAGRGEALVLTDALGDLWGVAELDTGNSTPGADSVTLAYRVGGNERADAFAALSSGGSFPDLLKVLTVGILEEHRFYVRDDDPAPRLARARTYPALEELWDGRLDEPVAENVLDLQVALGFDSSLAGGFFACDDDVAGDDDRVVETADGADDDWLFNRPGGDGEDDAEVPWTAPPATGWSTVITGCGDTPQPRLYYVRLATLVRSPRPDPRYRAPAVETLADHTYGTAADDRVNGEDARLHRRRVLETTIDLRNL